MIKDQSINIMLADDDEDDRNFFNDAIKELKINNNLTVFKNGSELMDYLEQPDVLSPDVVKVLDSAPIDWTRATMYRTVCSDLTDISVKEYDMLVFFSPQGIRSLGKNFENFEQKDTKIAVFGTTTEQAAKEAGLRVDVMAPSKETPSMTMAIEKYIRQMNK